VREAGGTSAAGVIAISERKKRPTASLVCFFGGPDIDLGDAALIHTYVGMYVALGWSWWTTEIDCK